MPDPLLSQAAERMTLEDLEALERAAKVISLVSQCLGMHVGRDRVQQTIMSTMQVREQARPCHHNHVYGSLPC